MKVAQTPGVLHYISFLGVSPPHPSECYVGHFGVTPGIAFDQIRYGF